MLNRAVVQTPAGPVLVPRPVPPGPGFSPLSLWHLLSLDAPSVAAVWTVFIARCAGLRLPWVDPAAMFVAVWMIYAADRLLDARVLDTGPDETTQPRDSLEERHRFHHAHRRAFLAGLTAGAFVLAFLLHAIEPRELRLYALLATLLGVWMLLIHARGLNTQRLPKEVAVAVFFPAAAFIPTVSRLPSLRTALLPSALLFAGACALNCLLLYAWEHAQRPPAAHWTTRWATRHLGPLAALLIAASALVAGLQRGGLGLSVGLSVALLWGLHRGRRLFAPVHLRALADLVLLTPLLWMFR